MGELRQKTLKGMAWNTVQTVANKGIKFFFMIFMTRLLLPSDYGMVGMLAIFMEIANAFIDSGFAQALIRKQDRTRLDESTMFYFNIFISALSYGVIFLIAPLVSKFYEIPELTLILRVLATTLIINSFATIQVTIYTIKIDFKTTSLVYIASNVITGSIGLGMAYMGYGVWALVWQQVLFAICSTLIFWFVSNWRPIWAFSWNSFRELFSFGSKLLGSKLLNIFYHNLSIIFIGKAYSSSDLGLFSKAEQLVSFPTSTLFGVVESVSYPVLCQMQSDKNKLTVSYRKFIRLTAFLMSPIMVILAIISHPLIIMLFGNEWSGAAIFFTLLCYPWWMVPIQCLNLNLLKVVGRTDLILRLEIIGKVIGVIILVVALPISIVAMCIGTIVAVTITYFINTYYTSRFIDLTIWRQLIDILRSLSLALLSGVLVYFTIQFFDSNAAKVLIGGLVGGVSYLVFAYILKMSELYETVDLIKRRK